MFPASMPAGTSLVLSVMETPSVASVLDSQLSESSCLLNLRKREVPILIPRSSPVFHHWICSLSMQQSYVVVFGNKSADKISKSWELRHVGRRGESENEDLTWPNDGSRTLAGSQRATLSARPDSLLWLSALMAQMSIRRWNPIYWGIFLLTKTATQYVE